VKLKEVFERKKERNRNFTGNSRKEFLYIFIEWRFQSEDFNNIPFMYENKQNHKCCRVAHLHSDLP
jgi:hypothetical protein